MNFEPRKYLQCVFEFFKDNWKKKKNLNVFEWILRKIRRYAILEMETARYIRRLGAMFTFHEKNPGVGSGMRICGFYAFFWRCFDPGHFFGVDRISGD